MPEIGLMGGSFNPIHRGHVALARAALDSGKVERVLFLPTGNPPHKREGLADKFDRLRMVELAVAHEAGMAVCREEIDRGGVIYTVDTLAALQSKMPDCSLTYLIGADTLRALGTWRRVETVIERCKFLVMMREGKRGRTSSVWPGSGRAGARRSTFWTRERWISPRRRSENIYGRTSRLSGWCPRPWRIISARAAFTGRNQAWS